MNPPSPPVDPTAARKNKPGWKSTPHPSAGLVIDVVKESSDDLTPTLKAVVDENKPGELSSATADPTVVSKDRPDWKSTLHASAGLVIDVVKESSDAFTPLKAVAGGLSAILKHYDVRDVYFSKPLSPLTSELANDGEPRINRIVDTPGR